MLSSLSWVKSKTSQELGCHCGACSLQQAASEAAQGWQSLPQLNPAISSPSPGAAGSGPGGAGRQGKKSEAESAEEVKSQQGWSLNPCMWGVKKALMSNNRKGLMNTQTCCSNCDWGSLEKTVGQANVRESGIRNQGLSSVRFVCGTVNCLHSSWYRIMCWISAGNTGVF